LQDKESHLTMILRALKPAREKIADHYNGKHTLDEKNVKTMEKSIATFEEKLSGEFSEVVSGRHSVLFCAKLFRIVSANTCPSMLQRTGNPKHF
jgi:hypothetical protein